MRKTSLSFSSAGIRKPSTTFDAPIFLRESLVGSKSSNLASRLNLFETEIFGAKVFELRALDSGPIESGDFSDRIADIFEQKPGMVSCRLLKSQLSSEVQDELIRSGFRHIETLCTLARSIGNQNGPQDFIREAEPSDVEELEQLAISAFQFDRFHQDSFLSDDFADEVKRRWVRNSLNGRADRFLIFRDQENIKGFCICLVNGRSMVIDLIAVHPSSQGRGIGSSLLKGALWAYKNNADEVLVGTQLSNVSSLKLYSKHRFENVSEAETYHWTSPSATAR